MARLALLGFAASLALYVGISAASFILSSFARTAAALETISARPN